MKNFALKYLRTDFKGERQGRLLSGSKSTKQITLRRDVRRESEILAASKSDYLSKSSWELSKYIFIGPFLGGSISANEIPSRMSVLEFWPYSHMTLAVLHFSHFYFLFPTSLQTLLCFYIPQNTLSEKSGIFANMCGLIGHLDTAV